MQSATQTPSYPHRALQMGALAMVASAACWGFGTVLSKATLESIPPVSLLVVQLLASSATLWVITFLRGIPFTRRDLKHGRTGLLEPGLAYLAGLIGLQLTSASNAALIGALEPFIILVLAYLFLKERIRREAQVLMGLAILGTLLVTGADLLGGGAGDWRGDLLELIGVAAAAGYVILSRNSVAEVAPVPLAAMQQSFGLLCALLALPVALLLGERSLIASVPVSLWIMGGITGVVQYAAAFTFYLIALQRIPATTAALFLTLIPLFGISGAALFLGEVLLPIQMVGGGLIVGALVLFYVRQARQG